MAQHLELIITGLIPFESLQIASVMINVARMQLDNHRVPEIEKRKE